MSDNNGNGENKIIKTQDENGQVFEFELIDIIEFEEQEYGLLVYLDPEQKEQDEEDEEVVIMKLNKIDGSYTFETIEDEQEFEKLIAYLEVENDEDEEEEE